MTIEQVLLQARWNAILRRQAEEREVLKRNHEEERELFYRSNKSTFDTMPKER